MGCHAQRTVVLIGLVGALMLAEPGSGQSCCEPTPPLTTPQFQNCGGSRPVGLPFAGRSPVYARNGMVASSQPLTTIAALDVLRAGGSAVDAAIAANAMEGVVEPMMNGMGGDLMAIVYSATEKKLFGLNSSGRSSTSTSYSDLKQLLSGIGRDMIPSKGPLPITVPGAVKGWCMLHERFGKLSWESLFTAAIDYATNGFPVSPVIASEWELTANTSDVTSNGRYPHAADGFYDTFTVRDRSTGARRAPRAGDIFRNGALAETLRTVAQGGCEAFYNGSIAARIAEFATQSGVRLTQHDFAAHHSEWVAPVNTTYRSRYRVFELPPNPQGLAALQQLNIMEGYNLTGMGFNSADALHVHVEAKKLAFADRAKYYADPDFVKVPVEGLLSKEYATQRRTLIDMGRAMERVAAGTPPGSTISSTSRGSGSEGTAREHSVYPLEADTMYLTTADGDGMMVSLIQSNFQGFGSGLVVPGLGFALQDRGALFSMDESAADVYVAGKRPFHTIMPGFVTRDDEPWLSFGVMGGNMQPQGHAQIISNLVDFGMNVQEAGDAARYDHGGSTQPQGGEPMLDGGHVELEAGVCASVRDELKRRGHHLIKGANSGGYQAIQLEMTPDGERVYIGASEMRKDGMAAGF